MQVYEVNGQSVYLQAENPLLILGLTEIMGKYGSTAAGFTYKTGGETRLAIDTFYGVNETTVSVTVYRYDGKGFIFSGSFGQHDIGDNLLIRRADAEADWAGAANCSEWWPVLRGGGNNTWYTADGWDSEDHDWRSPDDAARLYYGEVYRNAAAEKGLSVLQDPRIIPLQITAPQEGFDWNYQYNVKFLQIPETVYEGTDSLESLWRIGSYQLLGGPLELHREDIRGNLDSYRS